MAFPNNMTPIVTHCRYRILYKWSIAEKYCKKQNNQILRPRGVLCGTLRHTAEKQLGCRCSLSCCCCLFVIVVFSNNFWSAIMAFPTISIYYILRKHVLSIRTDMYQYSILCQWWRRALGRGGVHSVPQFRRVAAGREGAFSLVEKF